MSQLQSKKLLLKSISEKVFLLENKFFLVFYVPTKLRLKINVSLLKYKPFNLYKRTIKHSDIPAALKRHFSPGLGLIKFDDFTSFMSFLDDLKKTITNNFPSFKIVNVFFKNRYLFFSSVNNFVQFQNIITNYKLYFFSLYSAILFKVLHMLCIFKRCMYFSFIFVKKYANT